MNEVLPLKKITIIRILTMLGGFLGALLLLYEQEFVITSYSIHYTKLYDCLLSKNYQVNIIQFINNRS